ncbi:LysR family transcriptional regulator [Paraburkholderia piptadeniae]|uniref:LysR family transcriptional regulator n=1 Tax=Paraburkholderia piptadeniae TaxID=1701573 RepID=A0A1N7S2G8_9BURK|nr:LysR family transcriptional regulator [Paraburkholderia piptadeniae]SIT41524.1 LysR family transcriptional regulator [Paraburkholderia piptadeniae]
MRTETVGVDLHALQAFVAVCETRSMTQAAKVLGVTQSAVSQLIASLEREQGVALFDRECRPVRPNAAGKILFSSATGLLEHAHAVASHVRSTASNQARSLRIGCVESFAAIFAPRLVQLLGPQVSDLTISSGSTQTLSARLSAGELELAICSDAVADIEKTEARPLLSEQFVAVAPKKFADHRELEQIVRELPLLRYSAGSRVGAQIERFMRQIGLFAPKRYELDSTEALLSLVDAGFGCAITTPLCLYRYRALLGSTTVIPLPNMRPGHRDMFILTRRSEWSTIAETVSREALSIARDTITPTLQRTFPEAASSVFEFFYCANLDTLGSRNIQDFALG